MTTIDVVEYTDPTCSWAWGTEPKYRRLHWQYDAVLSYRRAYVGIFDPDWKGSFLANTQASSEEETCALMSDYFGGIVGVTKMVYPKPLHRLPDDSEFACRLSIAAAAQGPAVGDRVLRRLRESFLVHGQPVDSLDRALAAVAGVPGLDADRLAADLDDAATEKAWQADWEEARNPNDDVLNQEDKRPGYGAAQPQQGRMRYGLPAMVLTGPKGSVTVSGWNEWSQWEAALEQVAPGITAQARPLPSVEEAFATWPTLTRSELDLLCGPDAQPPADVVEHTWAGGTIWVTAQEAATGRWAAA